MKNTSNRMICLALGLMLLLGLAGCAGTAASPAAAPAEQEPEITVSATSTVRLVPDKATVSFGVTTQEETAEAAQEKNTEAVNKVMSVLTGRGIEDKSIRTDRYAMYPRYEWSEKGEQRLVGYVVTTSMSVRDQDIEDLGKLISACVEAGINNVDSVTFLCSGYDEAYSQALAQAVEAAREKAAAIAAAAGKKLGEPVSVAEGWQDASAKYGRDANMAFPMDEAENIAGPVLQPGETEINASVTVKYRMD